jgi:hypothetical protein
LISSLVQTISRFLRFVEMNPDGKIHCRKQNRINQVGCEVESIPFFLAGNGNRSNMRRINQGIDSTAGPAVYRKMHVFMAAVGFCCHRILETLSNRQNAIVPVGAGVSLEGEGSGSRDRENGFAI